MQKDSFLKRWPGLVLILLITLGGGALVGFLTRDSMSVYNEISKPGFAPPSWIFPVAWTVLYSAMSLSLWLAIRSAGPTRAAIVIYALQLAVNLAWPFLFFALQAFGLAFVWLLVLLGLIIWLMLLIFPASLAGGLLLVPYAAWSAFAAVLNFAVARLNM